LKYNDPVSAGWQDYMLLIDRAGTVLKIPLYCRILGQDHPDVSVGRS